MPNLSPKPPNFHHYFTFENNPPMAFSRAHLFDRLAYEQSTWSKATAHPARIKILEYLALHGPLRFRTLARHIPLHYTTVSRHCRTLRELGLIEATEAYPHTYYAINEKACRNLVRKIRQFESSIEVVNSENNDH